MSDSASPHTPSAGSNEQTVPEEGEPETNNSSYLPAECQAAIDATNQKYNDMKEVWNNYRGKYEGPLPGALGHGQHRGCTFKKFLRLNFLKLFNYI